MDDYLLREEEITTPQDGLILLFECLTIISAGIDLPDCSLSNPSWIGGVIYKLVIVSSLKDGPPVVNGLDLIDSNEVIVVSVLVPEQLELRMETTASLKRVLVQVALDKFHFLLDSKHSEVEYFQELVDL